MKKIICWWSGGITSAVACKIAIDLYGVENVRVIFIDTKNEHVDTYRFMADCSVWYQKDIEVITGIGEKYKSIQDVWRRWNSLNVASGAVCSSELKREVREKWQKENEYTHQVFGFDLDEPKRVKAMKLNHQKAKPIFPLWLHGYSKEDCIKIVSDSGIEIPKMYQLGFRNNNCFGVSEESIGGCVQGGIGYWQKMKRDFPLKFDKMAEEEHLLTDRKGSPVTMLRLSKKKDDEKRIPLFLKPHPKYPNLPNLKDQKGREPEPLFECNGFCGTNDLEKRKETENELNFYGELFPNIK